MQNAFGGGGYTIIKRAGRARRILKKHFPRKTGGRRFKKDKRLPHARHTCSVMHVHARVVAQEESSARRESTCAVGATYFRSWLELVLDIFLLSRGEDTRGWLRLAAAAGLWRRPDVPRGGGIKESTPTSLHSKKAAGATTTTSRTPPSLPLLSILRDTHCCDTWQTL